MNSGAEQFGCPFLNTREWPHVPPRDHRSRVTFLQRGPATELRGLRDYWRGLITCSRGWDSGACWQPQWNHVETREGHSPKEIVLLPEEERKVPGRQNPDVFYILFFSWENWDSTITCPKAWWLLYDEPRFVLSWDQLSLCYVISRKYIMDL